MSTNFATTVTDPAYERDGYEDDAFREQHKPVRPSSEQLATAAYGLMVAQRDFALKAEQLRRYGFPADEVEFWTRRAAKCAEVIEWLDRGAP